MPDRGRQRILRVLSVVLFLWFCYTMLYMEIFNCSGQGIFLSGKAEQEASEIPPMWELAENFAYKQA